MSRRCNAAYAAGVVALGLMVMGCAGKTGSTAADAAAPTTQPIASATSTRVVEIPRRVLTFQPTRQDLTVGCAVFSAVSSKPMKLNGAAAQPWTYIYLKPVGKNQFELPALRIEYDLATPEDIGCMSVKIWFNEVTNYYDSGLYVNNDDRYALVAWCTMAPEKSKDTSYKARFGENRVATLEEFKQCLTQPFVLRMKQYPLKAEWGYPMVHNEGRRLSEADLAAVQKAVRDRGESYFISLMAGNDPDHGEVETSVGDMSRYQGTRRYKLQRTNGKWEVKSVEEHPNFSRHVYW